MKQYWIINAIVAVIAAIFAILQEYWIGTQMSVIGSVGYGTLIGLALSVCAEIGKSVFIDWKWRWRHVAIGSVFGIVAAIITALCVC